MPRRPRCVLPEGLFHVGSRGAGGITAFADGVDRDAFVDLLYQAANMFGVRMVAWTVLSTHFHLIVEATHEQLSSMMHRVIGMYAQRFNRRHGRKGHLFEERFWAWVIGDEDHFERAVRYVVNNASEAGLVVDWRDWPWTWSQFEPPRGTVPGTRPIQAATSGRAGRRALPAGRGPRPPASARCRRSGSAP